LEWLLKAAVDRFFMCRIPVGYHARHISSYSLSVRIWLSSILACNGEQKIKGSAHLM